MEVSCGLTTIGRMTTLSTGAPCAPSRARAWLLAARPHTLGVTLAAVLMACVLGWQRTGRFQPLLALLILVAAMLIQIGTNLLNDVGDYESGTDTAERLGPDRATAMGWLTPHEVRRAGAGALLLALVLGLVLAWQGGWPIVLLGLLSLVCGWAYTAGPLPISRGPFGELFVWVFFGLAAVLGTVWLQTQTLPTAAWLAGHAMGAWAAAVMLVNNTRDGATDARTGRRTLAVVLGLQRSRWLYALLVLLPFALLPWLNRSTGLAVWAPLLLLPLALQQAARLMRWAPDRRYNQLLARTAHLQLGYVLLWCAQVLLAA